MVAGDVKEPSTLAAAFSGADTAFVVVNFWDPEIGNKERELTNAIFDQAKATGVKHVIFSSLANVDKISSGQIKVPHFSLKADAWEYLQTLGFDAVTAVEPAAYYSNWFTFFKANQEEDGTLVWTWPGKKGNAFSQFDVNSGVGKSKIVLFSFDTTISVNLMLQCNQQDPPSWRQPWIQPSTTSATFSWKRKRSPLKTSLSRFRPSWVSQAACTGSIHRSLPRSLTARKNWQTWLSGLKIMATTAPRMKFVNTVVARRLVV